MLKRVSVNKKITNLMEEYSRDDIMLFKYSPIALANVERFFSTYKT